MKRQDFYYELPQELIAQEPIEQREMSRLMLLNRVTGELTHDKFKSIINYLEAGDCLVLNNTRVIPARLIGLKENTGGKIEFLLLHKTGIDEWEVILKPGRRAKIGSRFIFGNGELKAEIIKTIDGGNRLVRFQYDGIFEEVLDRLGEIPLPHYITKKISDIERYQTVYSKNKGSAAAPTAGLHFTHSLLEEIRNRGVDIVYVTLHVGLGTFRPVKADSITEHKMHSEYFSIDSDSAERINACKHRGSRVIAVGTTSLRTLESASDENGEVSAQNSWTDIFIYPGYNFKVVDALVTNFHLPESTLIMLISAFAGNENVMKAYKEAIDQRYRFYSLGDAMYIY